MRRDKKKARPGHEPRPGSTFQSQTIQTTTTGRRTPSASAIHAAEKRRGRDASRKIDRRLSPPASRAQNGRPERLRYLAGCVHSLGPKALYEFLREIEDGAPLAERLERYCGLQSLNTFIAAAGGRELRSTRLIRARRR